MPGVTIEQRVIPLDRVGCYVPGGRYPLPSSLLMTAIPARVAGVGDVIAVCPRPDRDGHAARRSKPASTRLFRLGGAHAIAALAYGTDDGSARRQDRRDRQRLRRGREGARGARTARSISSPGPSEIVIVSASGRADWIAADLIAQAEHDPDARAILLTPSRRLAAAVAERVRAAVASTTVRQQRP